MQSGQFIIGMVNGNIESYESPDLATLLPADKLSILWDLSKTRGLGNYKFVDYDNHAIAKSAVTRTEPDELGRRGTLNHTVIFKFDSIIFHDNLPYFIDVNAFQEAYQQGKLDFTLKLPELHNPLPKPEWG